MAARRFGTYVWVLVVAVGTYAAVGGLVDYVTADPGSLTWDDGARTWWLLVVGLGVAAFGAVKIRRRLAPTPSRPDVPVTRGEPDLPLPAPAGRPPPDASPRGRHDPSAGQRIVEGIVTGSVVAVVSAVVTNLLGRG